MGQCVLVGVGESACCQDASEVADALLVGLQLILVPSEPVAGLVQCLAQASPVVVAPGRVRDGVGVFHALVGDGFDVDVGLALGHPGGYLAQGPVVAGPVHDEACPHFGLLAPGCAPEDGEVVGGFWVRAGVGRAGEFEVDVPMAAHGLMVAEGRDSG